MYGAKEELGNLLPLLPHPQQHRLPQKINGEAQLRHPRRLLLMVGTVPAVLQLPPRSQSRPQLRLRKNDRQRRCLEELFLARQLHHHQRKYPRHPSRPLYHHKRSRPRPHHLLRMSIYWIWERGMPQHPLLRLQLRQPPLRTIFLHTSRPSQLQWWKRCLMKKAKSLRRQ